MLDKIKLSLTGKINSTIMKARLRHKALSDHQSILPYGSEQNLSYAYLELKKSILELKIAILRAIIGESK